MSQEEKRQKKSYENYGKKRLNRQYYWLEWRKRMKD